MPLVTRSSSSSWPSSDGSPIPTPDFSPPGSPSNDRSFFALGEKEEWQNSGGARDGSTDPPAISADDRGSSSSSSRAQSRHSIFEAPAGQPFSAVEGDATESIELRLVRGDVGMDTVRGAWIAFDSSIDGRVQPPAGRQGPVKSKFSEDLPTVRRVGSPILWIKSRVGARASSSNSNSSGNDMAVGRSAPHRIAELPEPTRPPPPVSRNTAGRAQQPEPSSGSAGVPFLSQGDAALVPASRRGSRLRRLRASIARAGRRFSSAGSMSRNDSRSHSAVGSPATTSGFSYKQNFRRSRPALPQARRKDAARDSEFLPSEAQAVRTPTELSGPESDAAAAREVVLWPGRHGAVAAATGASREQHGVLGSGGGPASSRRVARGIGAGAVPGSGPPGHRAVHPPGQADLSVPGTQDGRGGRVGTGGEDGVGQGSICGALHPKGQPT